MRELPKGTVTLLFTDMEESTRLLQRVGERYVDVLETCRHLLRSAFQQYHGHEVDTQGDAFFVAFARASDAVTAAVAAQRALATQVWSEDVAVRVRMGLHTGEPLLASEGYVGLDVHRAARIMSAGHGGQILLSHTTCTLVEHDLPFGVSLRDLGAHRLKDLEYPSHLYQLVIPDLPTDFPPLKTLDTHPNNLPIQLTPLIGREKEVTMVAHLLRRDDMRLLTLTGPGGTGKTRLGLQVAAELTEEYGDGVFFVNLAPIRDPALVLPTIALTLGVTENPTRSMLDVLQSFLQQKQILLLLDNFEQVVDAASQVTDLLTACPKLKVIVTSRAVLHVRGEHEFAVSPLALPNPRHLPDLVALSQYEAVALFIARARAVQSEFQVTNANAPAVAEICVRLDGLPLAIELAAARIKLLPPQALLARLGQRFAVLTSGARDVPARQQTLRNTIAWSYDLLEASEQRLFRRLCIFVGGVTLEAIEAVSAAPGDKLGSVLDGIGSLIDKSLLKQSEQESEQPRFVMLETIREYGWEALLRHRARGSVSSSNWVTHPIQLARPDSRLAMAVRGRGTLDRPFLDAVLSMHHQAVEELAPGMEMAAASPDGVIEAFEETAATRWWVGVQFHPEWMTQLSWALGLFTALIDASRGYSAVPRDEIETLLEEIKGWLRQHDRALYTATAPFALLAETQSERHHVALTLQRHVV